MNGTSEPSVKAVTAAPPIEIYHPVFGAFSKRSKDSDLNIPDKFLCQTASLLQSVSAISVEEDSRVWESSNILSEMLSLSFQHIFNEDWTSAGLISAQHTPLNVNAAPIMIAVESELGAGGSDPSVQSSFSYARFYCSRERAAIREISCCPAFLGHGC
ncbi:hypothetical protein BT96DRAFT_438032 [Gymnopus androsaceus JB14]|uniref:Uncharacterized protein n=1 Tax=Gymnopus androsaceus JB14 TaxID=1447944 RepID=A0A6A4GT35_9AGAR|nr:hypothetical protein BT96DRAFT_438032 [Gymnopus androsaceus JB14]